MSEHTHTETVTDFGGYSNEISIRHVQVLGDCCCDILGGKLGRQAGILI